MGSSKYNLVYADGNSPYVDRLRRSLDHLNRVRLDRSWYLLLPYGVDMSCLCNALSKASASRRSETTERSFLQINRIEDIAHIGQMNVVFLNLQYDFATARELVDRLAHKPCILVCSDRTLLGRLLDSGLHISALPSVELTYSIDDLLYATRKMAQSTSQHLLLASEVSNLSACYPVFADMLLEKAIFNPKWRAHGLSPEVVSAEKQIFYAKYWPTQFWDALLGLKHIPILRREMLEFVMPQFKNELRFAYDASFLTQSSHDSTSVCMSSFFDGLQPVEALSDTDQRRLLMQVATWLELDQNRVPESIFVGESNRNENRTASDLGKSTSVQAFRELTSTARGQGRWLRKSIEERHDSDLVETTLINVTELMLSLKANQKEAAMRAAEQALDSPAKKEFVGKFLAVAEEYLRPNLGPMKGPVRSGAQNVEELTARETEILFLLGRGLKNREISTSLGIKESTVKWYLTALYQKLDVRNRSEAIVAAQNVFWHKSVNGR